MRNFKKSIPVLFFSFCCFFYSKAQEFNLQLVGGLMNYGGDLQSQLYTFNGTHPTVGINAIYTVNHVGLRAGVNYGSVSAQDKITSEAKFRNLNFKSNIIEANLCLEYDFLTKEKSKIIPYIFAGIGFFHFNPYTTYDSQKVFLQPLGTEGQGLSLYPNRKFYSLTGFEDPFGVGVRFIIMPNLLIGFEYNSRLIFTDYLDDVSKSYPDQNALFEARGKTAVALSFRGDASIPFPSGKVRGNPHQNDNYYSSVITLTYIFQKRSSSSSSLYKGSGKRTLRALACPKLRR